MTSEEQIASMTKAINQAIKVMGDRFGSTEEDVARTIESLKLSMRTVSHEKAKPLPDGATSSSISRYGKRL